jgi:mycothiol synthase
MSIETDLAAIRWVVKRRLDSVESGLVQHLVDTISTRDGISPLSEHVLLHLQYGGDIDVRHVLAYSGAELLGYGHLDVTDELAGSSAELAVTPDARRRGIGHALVEHLQSESPDGRLRLWARGGQSGAAGLARSMGFAHSRTLLRMRRPLSDDIPEPVWPQHTHVRTFLPGLDDHEWLGLNARAFAELPDQAGWTEADLQVRMREPWFDPEGFFLAIEDNAEGREHIVGFHWTKVHGSTEGHSHEDGHEHDDHEHDDHEHDAHDDEPDDHEHDDHSHREHGHEPIGEVYVVGIDPDHRGSGLGRALTLVGLGHLRRQGLPHVMLYVDASNSAAIALYQSLGFQVWDRDVEFTVGAD